MSSTTTSSNGDALYESSVKETYLTLLPHQTLVTLILAIDRDRNTSIWPQDLTGAIQSLREQGSYDAAAHIHPTPQPPSHISSPVPQPLHPHPQPPPPAAMAPMHHPIPPHLPPHMHPHHPPPMHYPPPPQQYYVPPGVPVPVPIPPPPRLQRNATGRPPNGPGTAGIPSYEEMIAQALSQISDPDGVAPKVVFDYMFANWPLMNNFRPSASQALQKAFRRGRLEKVGGKYRLNPNWEGGSTSKRTHRRPHVDTPAQPPAPVAPPHMGYGYVGGPGQPYPPMGGYPGHPPPGAFPPGAMNPYQTAPEGILGKTTIKMESGDESEMEDEENGNSGERETEVEEDAPPVPPPPLPSLRESLRTLARLLAESVNGIGSMT